MPAKKPDGAQPSKGRPARVQGADKPLKWDEEKRAVLDLVFGGQFTEAQLATIVHMNVRTLRRLIAHPDFQAALAEKRADIRKALTERGTPFVRAEHRVIALAKLAEHAFEQYYQRPWLCEFRPVGGEGGSTLKVGARRKKGEPPLPEDEAQAAVRAAQVIVGGPVPPGSDAGAVEDETPQMLPLPPGNYVVNESYNKPAADEARAALDDIAKEFGDRKVKAELSGTVDLRERVLFLVPTVEELDESAAAADSAEGTQPNESEPGQ